MTKAERAAKAKAHFRTWVAHVAYRSERWAANAAKTHKPSA